MCDHQKSKDISSAKITAIHIDNAICSMLMAADSLRMSGDELAQSYTADVDELIDQLDDIKRYRLGSPKPRQETLGNDQYHRMLEIESALAGD